MSKTTFTSDEYNLLVSWIRKVYSIRNDSAKTDWRKPENKLIRELYKKFTPESVPTPGTDQSLVLKRTHLRYLEGELEKRLEILDTKTLPEYKKRESEEYVQKTQAVRNIISSVIERIRSQL
jgi:hypothetical protein